MNITKKENNNLVFFKDIDYGQCFIYYNQVYLKILCSLNDINAINLSKNNAVYLEQGYQIQPVKHELIIT